MTADSTVRTSFYPTGTPVHGDTHSEAERVHARSVWARAAERLERTLSATLGDDELSLLRDLLDAHGHAARLSVEPEVLPSQFTPLRERELTTTIDQLTAALDFQREIGKVHEPRPRENLFRHFRKQVALPERYGLHLSMDDVARLNGSVQGLAPHTIVRGASAVTLDIDGHQVLALLTPCAEDGTPTLTTAYTPQMLRNTERNGTDLV